MNHSHRRVLAAGKRIRVLIVDDSVVVRRLLTRALEQDAALEVAGFAANGATALAQASQLRPDAITLDIEMPGMNGLETLVRLRQAHPGIVVIMCSTLTERGAAITLEALTRGASDYVAKPSSGRRDSAACNQSLEQSIASIGAELSHKIHQFFLLPASPVAPSPPARPAPPANSAVMEEWGNQAAMLLLEWLRGPITDQSSARPE